ncbi:MAG: hypothetical protein AMJ81_02850 [Phycisphaerae bacterium SM23_33]|nr:MAG: hypothetical protein AMJ81_02850 [Phycisphaerae bacterium SM23_33]
MDVALQTCRVFSMAAPFLLLGFALAGVAHLLLPAERARRWLGRPGWGGVLKASLLGLPLPLCSCSVIPVATALRKQGAGKGATASFLISTPQTGVDSIAITYALLDPIMTVFRPIASLISAVVGGLMVDTFDPNHTTHQDGTVHLDQSCPHCEDDPQAWQRPAHAGRWYPRLLRFGFVEVAADVLWPLLIGLVFSGLIAALLPPDFFSRYLSNEGLSVALMLVVGLPFYVCAAASTPIAAVMILKGLSPGAAMVFLLAGPATNITTMLVVKQQLGWRSLWAYLGSVAALAMGLGMALNAVYHGFFAGRWSIALSPDSGEMLPAWLMHASAIILAGVLLAAAARKIRGALRGRRASQSARTAHWR